MIDKEYILYCDESEIKGQYYSNFYGGVMVGASQYENVVSILEKEKKNLNFFGEVKWSKVTERYLDKYISLIKTFFILVKKDHLKIRIMFRQNAHEANDLTDEDYKNSYFKLYYQFIKHAFGLEYAELKHRPSKLRLYFDIFPENREAASRFKGFLLGLNKNTKIQKVGFIVNEEDIAEVHSHDHVLLQCLDIILGAIHFRLNNKHKVTAHESRKRGRRTVAKDLLYKTVLEQIKSIKPEFRNFNIGISTACIDDPSKKWSDSYRHWNFIPKNYIYRHELTKGKQKTPTSLQYL